MTAPRIVDVTVNATQATYPQRVEIVVEWDQPLFNVEIENLIFETEQEPGITITGYTGSDNNPAPSMVYLGQTLVRQENILRPTPSSIELSFVVSPFMLGTLRVSNQSWNRPLVLNAENVNGEKGDWSPFLAAGVFSSVICSAYYTAMVPTATASINYSDLLRGTPKLKYDWACNGGVGKNNDSVNIVIGNDPDDMSVKPMVEWEGGNFWWWGADGLQGSTNPLPPYPYAGYYSNKDTRTCRGPQYYIWGGAGGLTIDTTQLPLYPNAQAWNDTTNKYGSFLASNYVQNIGTNFQRNWQSCLIFGKSSGNKLTDRNSSVGRMERWILANPQNGDPLKDKPATWTNQVASSSNNFCLAPWRLAKSTDPVPMLIQAYIQLNWIYTTNAPG
jgi:hypothetical protein